MTVQELIDELNKIEDKSLLVVQSRDEEGNGFKRTHEVEQPSEGRGFDNGEIEEGGTPCVVLWP